MRKRRRLWLAAVLALAAAAGVVLYLMYREPPPYDRVREGMTWEEVEALVGEPTLGVSLTGSGRLRKTYPEKGGRVRVEYENDRVVRVEYVPDNPDPDFWERLSRLFSG
jgi:hypothetical protein